MKIWTQKKDLIVNEFDLNLREARCERPSLAGKYSSWRASLRQGNISGKNTANIWYIQKLGQ